jgi:nucleotide-binding universal stress UspA family protein
VAKIVSILLVAAREHSIHQSVSRALMLARYLQARLDILLCDSERPLAADSGRGASHATEEAHQYLEALRKSVSAADIEITTDAAFEGPLHELVAQKARKENSTLVIKSATQLRTTHGLHANWQLIESCPVPLLLTHGRPWHPRARFAAAIDVMDRQWPGLTDRVTKSITSLKGACGADLDLVYAQPDRLPLAPEGESPAQLRLEKLMREFFVEPQHMHVLSGEASEVVTRFCAEHDFDLVALGVPGSPSLSAFIGSLSGRLLQSMRCDILFVNSGSDALQVRRPGSDQSQWSPLPWWN